MFKEMRRQDRSIDTAEASSLLEAGEYGILSTSGSNGYAYGVPISYIYSNGSIYFHSAVEGLKLENIKYNDKVSFCVVGNTATLPQKFSVNYESIIAFGKAAEVFDSEKQAALEGLVKKYSPAYVAEGLKYIQNDSGITRVFKIQIEHMTGKARR